MPSVRVTAVDPDLLALVPSPGAERLLIGIAGAPGASKTTLAEQLVAALGPSAAHVAMDGFHLSDSALTRLGRLRRKGAPDTFDGAGYANLMARIRADKDETVYAPAFARDLEQPIAGSIAVEPQQRVVVSEGSYLQLEDGAWPAARVLFDQVWFLHTDSETRLRRIIARHVTFGKSPEEAEQWVQAVDEGNARLVEASRRRADLVVDVTDLRLPPSPPERTAPLTRPDPPPTTPTSRSTHLEGLSMTSTSANPIGVHALVWVGGTSPAEIATAVQKTTAAGYDLLELSLHDAVNIDTADARRRFEEAGLAVTASRGLAPDADVSSEDLAVVARGEQLLQDSLDTVDAMGGKILTGALYSAFGKAQAPLPEGGRLNIVTVLRTLAKEAHGRGMTLGLEICNRYETNVVNTAADALRLCDAIGEDNVMVHLDTYHMNIEEDDLVRPVRLLAERLGYVHIGENHRGYLGAGHLDFGAFFHALDDTAYAGPITFESFSSAVVSPGLSNDLAIWRNLWEDGEDLAVHARRFIADGLSAASRRHS